MRSVVRVHLGPPFSEEGNGGLREERPTEGIWGRSSAGRAPALQAGGRQFDSVRLHQGAWPLNKIRFFDGFIPTKNTSLPIGQGGVGRGTESHPGEKSTLKTEQRKRKGNDREDI